MLAPYSETETKASRVLYINSKDATIIFNQNQSDFDFVLEEPIVVPEHHSMLMSVYSAEIPYSFYNFRDGVNTRLDYAITAFNTPATYDANGFLDLTAPGAATLILPEGNYNAVELANHLTANIANLIVEYDSIRMKFAFRTDAGGVRITLGLRNGPFTGTPDAPGDDMNEELGFDFLNTLGDPFVERDPAGLTGRFYGYTNATTAGLPPVVVPGPGADVGRVGPFFVAPVYNLFGDDVVDMTNSIRSLFIRTNLSTTSVLDSHIGGGFSNILTRVPINARKGEIINIRPVDGDVHKLLLKVKSITDISIKLTNQENQTLNLNGLTFDISLKLEFIANKDLDAEPNLRAEYVEGQREQFDREIQELKKTKKTKKKK